MKYFIDFEFLEGNVPCQIKGFNIPKWLIKPNNTIQPISVGICSNDGREYYSISKDFNLKEAWNRYDCNINIITKKEGLKTYWIRDNVLKPIYNELVLHHTSADWYHKNPHLGEKVNDGRWLEFNYKSLKWLINKYGKTNKQIAEEILDFVNTNWSFVHKAYDKKQKNKVFDDVIENYGKPQFYGYYSDYDWVVFCWLFGKMIDLPKGFPMYCIDLKQLLDDKVSNMEFRKQKSGDVNDYEIVKGSTNLQQFLDLVKGEGLVNGTYPKQTNEHNALQDAHFNHNLYKFLQTI